MKTLDWSGKTLGLSNTFIFWRIRMPACRQGILAGTVLAFARGLGEYGATSMLIVYIPGRTATISTTVYQLWRTNDDVGALKWVLAIIAISKFSSYLLEGEKINNRRHMSLLCKSKKKRLGKSCSCEFSSEEGTSGLRGVGCGKTLTCDA